MFMMYVFKVEQKFKVFLIVFEKYLLPQRGIVFLKSLHTTLEW